GLAAKLFKPHHDVRCNRIARRIVREVVLLVFPDTVDEQLIVARQQSQGLAVERVLERVGQEIWNKLIELGRESARFEAIPVCRDGRENRTLIGERASGSIEGGSERGNDLCGQCEFLFGQRSARCLFGSKLSYNLLEVTAALGKRLAAGRNDLR